MQTTSLNQGLILPSTFQTRQYNRIFHQWIKILGLDDP